MRDDGKIEIRFILQNEEISTADAEPKTSIASVVNTLPYTVFRGHFGLLTLGC